MEQGVVMNKKWVVSSRFWFSVKFERLNIVNAVQHVTKVVYLHFTKLAHIFIIVFLSIITFSFVAEVTKMPTGHC